MASDRLREALQRIAKAEPDRLDHAIDVGLVERCAKVAREANQLELESELENHR